MTYKNCKKLIENNRYIYDDMINKLDVFLLADRVTIDEYKELLQMIKDKK